MFRLLQLDWRKPNNTSISRIFRFLRFSLFILWDFLKHRIEWNIFDVFPNSFQFLRELMAKLNIFKDFITTSIWQHILIILPFLLLSPRIRSFWLYSKNNTNCKLPFQWRFSLDTIWYTLVPFSFLTTIFVSFLRFELREWIRFELLDCLILVPCS